MSLDLNARHVMQLRSFAISCGKRIDILFADEQTPTPPPSQLTVTTPKAITTTTDTYRSSINEGNYSSTDYLSARSTKCQSGRTFDDNNLSSGGNSTRAVSLREQVLEKINQAKESITFSKQSKKPPQNQQNSDQQQYNSLRPSQQQQDRTISPLQKTSTDAIPLPSSSFTKSNAQQKKEVCSMQDNARMTPMVQLSDLIMSRMNWLFEIRNVFIDLQQSDGNALVGDIITALQSPNQRVMQLLTDKRVYKETQQEIGLALSDVIGELQKLPTAAVSIDEIFHALGSISSSSDANQLQLSKHYSSNSKIQQAFSSVKKTSTLHGEMRIEESVGDAQLPGQQPTSSSYKKIKPASLSSLHHHTTLDSSTLVAAATTTMSTRRKPPTLHGTTPTSIQQLSLASLQGEGCLQQVQQQQYPSPTMLQGVQNVSNMFGKVPPLPPGKGYLPPKSVNRFNSVGKINKSASNNASSSGLPLEQMIGRGTGTSPSSQSSSTSSASRIIGQASSSTQLSSRVKSSLSTSYSQSHLMLQQQSSQIKASLSPQRQKLVSSLSSSALSVKSAGVLSSNSKSPVTRAQKQQQQNTNNKANSMEDIDMETARFNKEITTHIQKTHSQQFLSPSSQARKSPLANAQQTRKTPSPGVSPLSKSSTSLNSKSNQVSKGFASVNKPKKPSTEQNHTSMNVLPNSPVSPLTEQQSFYRQQQQQQQQVSPATSISSAYKKQIRSKQPSNTQSMHTGGSASTFNALAVQEQCRQNGGSQLPHFPTLSETPRQQQQLGDYYYYYENDSGNVADRLQEEAISQRVSFNNRECFSDAFEEIKDDDNSYTSLKQTSDVFMQEKHNQQLSFEKRRPAVSNSSPMRGQQQQQLEYNDAAGISVISFSESAGKYFGRSASSTSSSQKKNKRVASIQQPANIDQTSHAIHRNWQQLNTSEGIDEVKRRIVDQQQQGSVSYFDVRIDGRVAKAVHIFAMNLSDESIDEDYQMVHAYVKSGCLEALKITQSFQAFSHMNYSFIERLMHRNLRIINLTFNRLRSLTGMRSVDSVHFLNVSYNELENLDGIEAFTGLKEFHATYNRISTISAVQIDKILNLQLVDVSSNEILDFESISAFREVHSLQVLLVSDNPITRLPHYFQICQQMLPTVQVIEGTSMSSEFTQMEHICFADASEIEAYFTVDEQYNQQQQQAVDINQQPIQQIPPLLEMEKIIIDHVDALNFSASSSSSSSSNSSASMVSQLPVVTTPFRLPTEQSQQQYLHSAAIIPSSTTASASNLLQKSHFEKLISYQKSLVKTRSGSSSSNSNNTSNNSTLKRPSQHLKQQLAIETLSNYQMQQEQNTTMLSDLNHSYESGTAIRAHEQNMKANLKSVHLQHNITGSEQHLPNRPQVQQMNQKQPSIDTFKPISAQRKPIPPKPPSS